LSALCPSPFKAWRHVECMKVKITHRYPGIIDEGELSASCLSHFNHGKTTLGNHLIKGWVGTRPGWNGKEKIPFLYQKWNLSHPAQSLNWTVTPEFRQMLDINPLKPSSNYMRHLFLTISNSEFCPEYIYGFHMILRVKQQLFP
jgi:hypothetical protein